MRYLLAGILLIGLCLPLWAAECTCATAKAAGGWCQVHQRGYVGGVEVRSDFLFMELDAHGHQLDPTRFPCPVCQRAIATDGYCFEHKIGWVSGLAYFSRLTYLLARGKLVPDADIKCPVCRKNAKTHGWCPSSKLGMAGHIAIEDPQAFQEIEKELHVLEMANEAAKRCVQCAVAMVTDDRCPLCRITYKDGVPVK